MTSSENFFQRLTAGGTFERAWAIFVKRYDLFLLLSGIIFLPSLAAIIAIRIFLIPFMHSSMPAIDASFSSSSSGEGNDVDQQEVLNDLSTGYIILLMVPFFLGLVASMILTVAIQPAMSYAVGLLYVSRDPHWRDCLRVGFKKWCDLFCAWMTCCLGVWFGSGLVLQMVVAVFMTSESSFAKVIASTVFFAWVVAIILVSVALIIAGPVIMIENLGPMEGIKRTWNLSQGHKCYIFCTLFCYILPYLFGRGVLAHILISVGLSTSTGLGAFLMRLPTLFFLPFTIILVTVVYLNIRVQLEGMDRNMLLKDLDGEEETTMLAFEPVLVGKTGQYTATEYIPVPKADLV